jgi:hypothetical protein
MMRGLSYACASALALVVVFSASAFALPQTMSLTLNLPALSRTGELQAPGSGVGSSENGNWLLNSSVGNGVETMASQQTVMTGSTINYLNSYPTDSSHDPNGEQSPVPEPTTLILVGTGLVGSALWRKRRR